MRKGLLVVALLGLACGPFGMSRGPSSQRVEVADDKKYDPSKDTVHHFELEAPRPPDDVLLQIFDRNTGEFDRIYANGSYKTGKLREGKSDDSPKQVHPKGEDPRNRMDKDALEQLEKLVAEADFVHSPGTVEGDRVGADVHKYVFTAFWEDTAVPIEVEGSLARPESMGKFAGIVTLLGDEVWSGRFGEEDVEE